MVGIVIRWTDGPFCCEFRAEKVGGSLYIYCGEELVCEEPVASAAAAFARAQEITGALGRARAGHA